MLSQCKVAAAGFINGGRGGPRIAWQTQTGFTPEDGVLGGVVLLHRRQGRWVIFAQAFKAYRYAAPRLSEDGLLHVAGRGGGSGAPNADLLFKFDDGRWLPIDLASWWNEIPVKLPEGQSIIQGVDYDFDHWRHGLIARTPLWRARDANGGPTGGRVIIVFRLDGLKLAVDRVLPDCDQCGGSPSRTLQ